MDLKTLREELDQADHTLIKAFEERMRISGQIGAVKKAQGRPIFDADREAEKLRMAAEQADPEFAGYVQELYRELMRLSKVYQEEKTNGRQL